MKLTFGKYIIYALLLFTLFACESRKKNEQQTVIEVVELDQLPMYGSTAEYGALQKNEEQLEADKQFLKSSDEVQPSRVEASKDYVEMGWFYLKQGDSQMAMRRANQAWQLDETNPDPFILFAAILNAREDNLGALDMLDRGITLKPDYISLYDMYLSESVDVYRQTGDASHIHKLIRMLDNITLNEDSLKQKVSKLKQDAELYLK